MSTTEHSVWIHFGCLCDSIEEQLEAQGLELDMTPTRIAHLQQDVDEVARLRIRGVLTEKESDRARERLFKTIKKYAREAGE